LFDVPIKNSNDFLRIVYSPGDANMGNSIQVQKIYTLKNDSMVLLLDKQRYNCVDSFYFKNDSIFSVVVADTSYHTMLKRDTAVLEINYR
jgi:hypothetical protein